MLKSNGACSVHTGGACVLALFLSAAQIGAGCGSDTEQPDPNPTVEAPGEGTNAGGNEAAGGSDGGAGGEAACDDDLLGDPLNCGFCGHVCATGRCNDGVCLPTVFAGDVTGPQSVVVDDGMVYWTSFDTAVSRCPADGCGEGADVLTESDGATKVFLEGGEMVFNDAPRGLLIRCPSSGCGDQAAPVTAATGAADVVMTADTVYFTDGTSVLSCPRAGCGVPTPIATGREALNLLLVESNLFISDRMADTIVSCTLPDCAGGPTPVVADEPGVLGMATEAGRLYWTNQRSGQVRSCTIADCSDTVETLSTNHLGPTGIATEGGWVYWTSFGGGTVLGCPVDGCPEGGPLTFATGQNNPIAIDVDENQIYWSNVGDVRNNFVGGGVFGVSR